jgi:deoxyribose-phosphate aldolase
MLESGYEIVKTLNLSGLSAKLPSGRVLTGEKLASMIDHTALKPEITVEDVKRLCIQAVEYTFATVCIPPVYVATSRELLKSTGVDVCTVVGFPLGMNTGSVKTREAEQAISDGAKEIDMVMNYSALRSGEEEIVSAELASVASICKREKRIMKVILECCYLDNDQKKRAARLVAESGADFAKTSTGFGSGGATVEDVKLLRSVLPPKVKIKAAGGIKTLDQALAMIDAGADRIGTSSAIQILQTLRETSH